MFVRKFYGAVSFLDAGSGGLAGQDIPFFKRTVRFVTVYSLCNTKPEVIIAIIRNLFVYGFSHRFVNYSFVS
jgi:hypothetical protein